MNSDRVPTTTRGHTWPSIQRVAVTADVASGALGVPVGEPTTQPGEGILVQAPDGQLLPVEADQLIAAANAVLDGQ
ncbi:MAG: hypothetical protein H0X22_08470 [Acidimicrobiia bacterium]|nr:hypothetical protein [Acidimicrobiia bacterium]